MYIHALVTIVLERAWAALKCDQLPVGITELSVTAMKAQKAQHGTSQQLN